MEELNKEMCVCCNGTGMVEGDHYEDKEPCLMCKGKGFFEWKTQQHNKSKAEQFIDHWMKKEGYEYDNIPISELMQSYADQELKDVLEEAEKEIETKYPEQTDEEKDRFFDYEASIRKEGAKWLLNHIKQRKG